jgi:DNA polymerase (family 10)
METAQTQSMNNREMAAVFFNIATLLREEGNENPFRTAAYERAGRAMMGLREEAGRTLESEKLVPFRRRQHIGKKLQAKIREMAEAGALEQYRALLEELPPFQRELLAVPGIGPKRARLLHEKLGVETADGLIRAARNGRLRTVPGFGARRVAEIATLPLAAERETLNGAAVRLQLELFEMPRAA